MKRIYLASLAGASLVILGLIYFANSKESPSETYQIETVTSRPQAATYAQSTTGTASLTTQEALGINNPISRREIGTVMQEISEITEQTDGNYVYGWFLELQQELNENGEVANIVSQRISELDSESASSRRQLSLLYGALAQSHSSEALEALLQSIEANQDEYHMIQAIAAVGDHPSPTEEAAETLWEQSQSHPEPLVRSTALLALGSVANRNPERNEYVNKQLVSLSQAPLDNDSRSVLISAMGNHGDAEYWDYLKKQGEDSDEAIRASAIYASRFLPQDEVNAWITELAIKDSSIYVKNEALKVLGFRSEKHDLSQAITEVTLSAKDRDLHFHAANLLLSLVEDYTESAASSILRLKQASPFEDVREFLNQAQL